MKKHDFSVCNEVSEINVVKCRHLVFKYLITETLFSLADVTHFFFERSISVLFFLCSCPGLLWHHGCWVCGWRRLPLHHVPIWWRHQRGRPQAVFWSFRGGRSWCVQMCIFLLFFFLSLSILCMCVCFAVRAAASCSGRLCCGGTGGQSKGRRPLGSVCTQKWWVMKDV